MSVATTRLADEFKGGARYAAIEGVFKLIDAGATATEVWANASRVMQNLNGDERSRLPDLIKQALKERQR